MRGEAKRAILFPERNLLPPNASQNRKPRRVSRTGGLAMAKKEKAPKQKKPKKVKEPEKPDEKAVEEQ